MTDPWPIEEMLVRAAQEFPDAEERARFLDWACRDDAEMRARIDRLLTIQLPSEAFFDFQPFALDSMDPPPVDPEHEDLGEIGLRIGRYRLISRLGDGGCGVVYQAEQETPVKRQVALKLIRMGLDHEQVIARFELERQALAMMDHPGIARVLDAGATPTGRPYFVMEWVTGQPVTFFCDLHRLTIRQRLELFIRICHAIQHAHLKGVIHRDIKPANVLASFHDGLPLPKVIDFGIAKIHSSAASSEGDDGDSGVGTPAYMSPEQRQSGSYDVDTRTDVYSLGVLLCELLVAQTPFPLNKITTRSRSHSPSEPSTRVVMAPSQLIRQTPVDALARIAQDRSCSPSQLLPLMQGDLDAIVLQCLQEDRQRRYDTPNALANDIRRHLDDKVIVAGHPHWRIKALKFVRRQRWAITITSVAFFTLAAGFSTSTWLFFREAEARKQQVQLRTEADQALAREAKLRTEAEAREACVQASVKLFYDHYEDADRLIDAIPLDLIPPSLESAETFRKLGEWHRKSGRIALAAKRYFALAQSMSSVDLSDLHQVSSQLLPAAVASCAVNDGRSYEKIRQVALERFRFTQEPIVAEQMIKACLLRPADQETMQKIGTLATFLESSIGPAAEMIPHLDSAAWHCYSMALWHHRRQDADKTMYWAKLSLQKSKEQPARITCVELLWAMSLQRQGETTQARELLATSASRLTAKKNQTSGQWSEDLGDWVDWTNAYLLFLEAQQEISSP